MFLIKVKGFEINKAVAKTFMYEGDRSSVEIQERQINEIAIYKGVFSAENYSKHNTSETSAPWDNHNY